MACADEHGEGGEFGGVVGEGECCVGVVLGCLEGVDKCGGIVACVDFGCCLVCSQHNHHHIIFENHLNYIFKGHLDHIALFFLRDHVLIPHDPRHPRRLSFLGLKHGDYELEHDVVDEDEEASAYACEEGMSEESEHLGGGDDGKMGDDER